MIETLISGVDLSEEEAEACLNLLLHEPNEALISALLVLLRAKGETYEEVLKDKNVKYLWLPQFFYIYNKSQSVLKMESCLGPSLQKLVKE